jgi:hypothetical protein
VSSRSRTSWSRGCRAVLSSGGELTKDGASTMPEPAFWISDISLATTVSAERTRRRELFVALKPKGVNVLDGHVGCLSASARGTDPSRA